MRRLPPSLASSGYSPARYVPLSPAPELDQGQRLTDIQAIQRLFANGESGGYWPADPAYLYEDSAGTIPASVNGVVGLRMDVSRGLAVGPERVTNGDFLNGSTGWTVVGSDSTHVVTFTTGSMRYQSDTLTPVLSVTQSGVFTANTLYFVTINTIAINGGSFIKHDGALPLNLNLALGEKTFLFYATATEDLILRRAGTNIDVTISSISIRKILGNYAFQSTTANKPYLRCTSVSNKYWLDSNTSTGALTATFSPSLGSACTIATVGAEGVTIAENQTVSTTYNIAPAFGYNGDVLIINRALTAVEKALVKRVLGRNVPTLGSELVTNGTFEVDSGWVITDELGITIANGVLNFDGATTIANSTYMTEQVIGVVADQFYVSKLTSNTSGSLSMLVGNATLPTVASPGEKVYVATSGTATVKKVLFQKRNASAVLSGSIDNITVKAIL